MTTKQAAKILRDFNKWRRGEEPYNNIIKTFPFDVVVIGQAIDVAVKLCSGTDKGVSTKKLDEARSALKVISTWATFKSGVALMPRDVQRLCAKALEETK